MNTPQSFTTSRAPLSTLTHADRMRKLFASNRQRIQVSLGLSQEQYFMFVFETGMQFLELFYDPNGHQGALRIQYLSQSDQSGFWPWFQVQFMEQENDIMIMLGDIQDKITVQAWKEFHFENLIKLKYHQAFRVFEKYH